LSVTGSPAFQLHDELPFEDMQEDVRVVAMRRVRGARRIDVRPHDRFLAGKVRQRLHQEAHGTS
jgi:hypothetical protein